MDHIKSISEFGKSNLKIWVRIFFGIYPPNDVLSSRLISRKLRKLSEVRFGDISKFTNYDTQSGYLMFESPVPCVIKSVHHKIISKESSFEEECNQSFKIDFKSSIDLDNIFIPIDLFSIYVMYYKKRSNKFEIVVSDSMSDLESECRFADRGSAMEFRKILSQLLDGKSIGIEIDCGLDEDTDRKLTLSESLRESIVNSGFNMSDYQEIIDKIKNISSNKIYSRDNSW